jgi:transcriptional regulator with XRE-family HTH domain
MAALPKMLEDSRRRAGWSMAQVAWRLGVSVREYRELEGRRSIPNWETLDRICEFVLDGRSRTGTVAATGWGQAAAKTNTAYLSGSPFARESAPSLTK